MNVFRTPENMPAPIAQARYSHTAEIEAGSKMLIVSGQLGETKDGHVPEDARSQIELAWENVIKALEDAGYGIKDVVKICTYLTSREYREYNSEIRAKYLGDHRPAQLLLFVSGLTLPHYKVEIEAIAAKKD